MKPKLFKLKGKLQHYQWGGYHFLPSLLGLPGQPQQPCAEYWLGAHVNAPAEIVLDGGLPLDKFINADPDILGDKVKSTFGRLPYLLKVLDVKDMLSIQVHPSREAALIEFENENKKGVPLNAADRNYKDNNHKPELMVALSAFWLLHGFKSENAILVLSQSIPEFSFMADLLSAGGLKHLYKTLMEAEQEKVNNMLEPLLQRIIPSYEQGKLSKEDPHFWAARAALTYNDPKGIDRGIFSVYLLNLVHLKAGEAIFQDAGVLHAYLEGQNMEIMANSDNVLRGGLTPKHIDVQELMKHISFQPLTPAIIHGIKRKDPEEVFYSPAKDFELSVFKFSKDATATVAGDTVDIYILMEGSLQFKEGGSEVMLLKKGEAALSIAGAVILMTAVNNVILYRATVPGTAIQ